MATARTFKLSGVLDIDGDRVHFYREFDTDTIVARKFELAAGEVFSLNLDATQEGTALTALVIRCRDEDTGAVWQEISYGVSDADAADPANGTDWRVVDGLHLSWEALALSTLNFLYIYNSGSALVSVEVYAFL
jgi:hypothetical protein